MARKNRVTVPDGIYHVTARIAHGAMLFGDGAVKDRILEWIHDIALFSGVEVYAFCIMDNHLHLLVHVPRVPERYWTVPREEPAAHAFGMRPPECRAPLWTPPADEDSSSRPVGDCPPSAPARAPVGFSIPDDEMASRLAHLYGGRTSKAILGHWARMRRLGCSCAVEDEKAKYCRRMYNLSQFMKTIAERVAQRYNDEFGHRGCLWQGRFYSGVVENASSVLAIVAAYIDYNPVKAGIAASPDSWRWSSFGVACSGEGEYALHARKMYERMLGCPWPEARRRMEAVFADELPEDINEETLRSLRYGSEDGHGAAGDDEATTYCASEGRSHGGGRPHLRASQAIRTRLWILQKGGYIGRSMEFGIRVASALPAMFPRPGMKSLRLCGKLSWVLPRLAA